MSFKNPARAAAVFFALAGYRSKGITDIGAGAVFSYLPDTVQYFYG